MQVKDSVGLVVGGGSGLGEGTVRMLVEGGGRAVILDLPSSRGAEIAEELGESVRFITADVTKPDQVEKAVAEAFQAFGQINVLANCAGVSPAHRMINRDGEPYPLDLFRFGVEVNLIGLFDVVRWAALHMSRQDEGDDGERGLIVNVASVAAFEGQVGQASYSASKGGVAALTLPLARDLAQYGIRVMCVAPGIMDTAMLSGLDDKRRAALIDIHVFPKRLGVPADFAALVKTFMETTLLNGEVVRLDAATRLAPR